MSISKIAFGIVGSTVLLVGIMLLTVSPKQTNEELITGTLEPAIPPNNSEVVIDASGFTDAYTKSPTKMMASVLADAATCYGVYHIAKTIGR